MSLENQYLNVDSGRLFEDRSTVNSNGEGDGDVGKKGLTKEKMLELVSMKDNNHSDDIGQKDKGDDHLLFRDPLDDFSIEKDITLSTSLSVNNQGKWRGNLRVFSFDIYGNPRLCIGPHCIYLSYDNYFIGPFTLCLNTFMLGLCILYIYGLQPYLNLLVLAGAIGVMLSFFGFYLATALVNPGIVTKEDSIEAFPDKEALKNYRICNICKIVQRPGENTNHCEDCNICIKDFDHHCPWVSKCIGKGNQLFFNLFLSFTLILFLYMMLSLFTIKPEKLNQGQGQGQL